MPVFGVKGHFNKIASGELERALFNKLLVEAAYEGNIAQLRKALSCRGDIDFQSNDDTDLFANALHINRPYYQHGGLKNTADLQEFSKDKPDPRFHPCGSGNTALMRAVFRNHENAVILLLEKGAKIHLLNSVGQDALYIARMTENSKMQKILADAITRHAMTLTGSVKIGRPLKYKKPEDDPQAP